MKTFTRRTLIGMLGVGVGSGLLAACAQSAPSAQPTTPAAPTAAPKPTTAPAAAPTTAPAAAAAATTAPAAPAPTTAPAVKPAATQAASAAPSGTLTVAQGVDAESLDPYVTTSGASKGMLWTIFDRLVFRDLDLALKPGLATSWKALDDATWELKLRSGVTFHNGEPFDANAVKFSFGRYVDPSIKNGYATLLKPVTEVQVIDPMTVLVKTSE